MIQPGIPKGTRNFGPSEMKMRRYMFDQMEEVFIKHGFQEIYTPAIENLETLTGKYGEDGEKLIFQVKSSGAEKCDKGLRYDLTVPLARYIASEKDKLVFPFKRYQIGPVWRGDRPQKGRYREFFQSDIDIVGNDSLLCEVEIIKVIDEVFSALGLKVKIRLGNRKLTQGILDWIGCGEKFKEILPILDKLDKIGLPNVMEELRGIGIGEEKILKLKKILELSGTVGEKIEVLEKIIFDNLGLNEVKAINEYLGVKAEIDLDISLVRGLDYYTGTIFEVVSIDYPEYGSISGGGRYDNLGKDLFGFGYSGVGVSFGIERIYDVMEKAGIFYSIQKNSIDWEKDIIMFINFGGQESIKKSLELIEFSQGGGWVCELYPEPVKLKKQMKYANARGVLFVVMIGENEIKEGKVRVKDMETRKEEVYTVPQFRKEFYAHGGI